MKGGYGQLYLQHVTAGEHGRGLWLVQRLGAELEIEIQDGHAVTGLGQGHGQVD